ncbi:MAG: acyl--CoA ligase [Deltaproteobacteria bacterium]|nr:acyl--CoA ligase [Deltaproteobacteria bacterium]
MTMEDIAPDGSSENANEAQIRAEVRQQLVGPGGPFEITTEEVLGERLQVFKNRAGSLRELLVQSALHDQKEYVVHGDRRIRYADHVRLVASVAQALATNHGIGKGDRVAILAANCPEWILTFWAATSLGAVVCALNGWWTAREIQYGVEHTGCKLLVGDRKRLSRVAEIDLGVPILEIESQFAALEQFAPDAELPSTPIREDDPALILFTSGTTGKPKGAVVSHRALIGFVQVNSMQGLERIIVENKLGNLPSGEAPPPAALITAPLFHLSGLYTGVIMMLAAGAKTVYRSGRFDPEDVLRLIEKESITIWSALGSMGPQVISHPTLDQHDLSSMRNIGFGGAPTSPALQEKMRKAFPNSSKNIGLGYGLSESGGLGASIGGRELELKPTSTGRASITGEIEIRDDDNKSVADGVYGEIHLRSPYLMIEYWNNPDATSETLKPGRWLATGDIGCLEDGYLFINSRARDLILRAAENVYPVEIEHRLDAHPDVAESAVIGVDHDLLGQEVKAVVVPRAGVSELDTDALASWVGEVLAPFKVPSLWTIRAEPLPRNASGKVLKTVLTGETENDLIDE